MIRVYDATEKRFNHNGIKALHPFFAEITKVKNGDYYLEVDDMIDNLEYYQKGMILRVSTPWGVQGFRCDNPRVENNRVTCKAWHLFYDSKNYVLSGHWSRSGNCNKVLKEYNLYTDVESPFTVSSDILELETDTKIEDASLYNVFEYLRDLYEGVWVRDNFTFKINKSTGEDRGVVLAYNKNITDIKVEENWDNVCTKILPYTMVGDEKITLNVQAYNFDPFITLEDIGQENPYDIPYTKVLEFKNESGTEDYGQVREWLYHKATEYLVANKFHKANYSVSSNIDNVSDVGDIIRVKHPKCKIDLETEVISVKYDAIKGKYTAIEFGNFRKAIKNFLTETTAIKGEIAKTNEAIQAASSVADLLTSGKVIYRGDDILVVDKLPAEEATNCYRISDTGISFSNSGMNGTFTRVMGIDGTFELGGSGNVGKAKIYNASGVLAASLDKDGLLIYTDAGKCLQIGNAINSSILKLRVRQKTGDTYGAWRYLQEEAVVLYDGLGSSTSVTLNTRVYNSDFSYIEIFYTLFTTGYDGNKNDFYHSVKVPAPLGKRVSLVASTVDASGNLRFGVGVVKIVDDSTNAITKITFETGTNSGIANKTFVGTNMATAGSTQEIFIRKVVGYR